MCGKKSYKSYTRNGDLAKLCVTHIQYIIRAKGTGEILSLRFSRGDRSLLIASRCHCAKQNVDEKNFETSHGSARRPRV